MTRDRSPMPKACVSPKNAAKARVGALQGVDVPPGVEMAGTTTVTVTN